MENYLKDLLGVIDLKHTNEKLSQGAKRVVKSERERRDQCYPAAMSTYRCHFELKLSRKGGEG